MAPIGVTAEQAGVIATRPATTPEAPPSDVAWPSRIFSVSSQPSAAAPVATMVFTQTTAAVPPAKSIAARLLAIQPPVWVTAPASSVSVKSKTQWATGKYTTVAQTPA